MKDKIFLLLAGVACALGAWAFWHYLGKDAMTVLLSVVALSATADNVRLRRKLRDMKR